MVTGYWVFVTLVYIGFFGGFFYFAYCSWKEENKPKKDGSEPLHEQEQVRKVEPQERKPLSD